MKRDEAHKRDADIVRLLKAGESIYDISALHRVSTSYIHTVMTREGLTFKKIIVSVNQTPNVQANKPPPADLPHKG